MSLNKKCIYIYEWTNGIGTYLYVYNDHNMYGINGTEGEIEIYNDDVDSSSNMAGRSYEDSFLGKGFVEDTTLDNQQYADFLFNAGYIEGDGSGDLKVGDKITRAEFCTMYNRIIVRENALLIDTDGNAVAAETYGFTYLDEGKWYYENMLRATSAYEGAYVSIEKRGIRNVLDDCAG